MYYLDLDLVCKGPILDDGNGRRTVAVPDYVDRMLQQNRRLAALVKRYPESALAKSTTFSNDGERMIVDLGDLLVYVTEQLERSK